MAWKNLAVLIHRGLDSQLFHAGPADQGRSATGGGFHPEASLTVVGIDDGLETLPLLRNPNDRDAAQCRLARLIASERAPTTMRLKAHIASRLNQLRDTNL